jgi:large subunit ribosomal protein L16
MKILFFLRKRKRHKGRVRKFKFIKKSAVISRGAFGIKALESGRITCEQIETIRRIFVRSMKKQGFFFKIISPNFSLCCKPGEMRMGKGKGKVKLWICKISAGKLLFEFGGLPIKKFLKIFSIVVKKIPVRSKFVNL